MAKTAPDATAVLRRFRGRIEFHRQVSGMLAGVRVGHGAMSVPEGAAGFMGVAALQRLRQLVARHPDLAAEGDMAGRGLSWDTTFEKDRRPCPAIARR